MSQPATSRRLVNVVVFVVGAASLGSEITAARLLAPFFGASTVVWANTIAVVLVALSLGYWFGGRLADRNPEPKGLYQLTLGAGVLLALMPLVAKPFLGTATEALDALSAGAFAGSLIGVLALVALPVVLLGAAAPYAIRLLVGSVDESGSVAGRLYAISTFGSLVGTFLAALLLIPALGTRLTFTVFALALVLVSALGLGRRYILFPLAVSTLFVLKPSVEVKRAAQSERLIYERDTSYQYVRVVERSGGERLLELNEGQAVHSRYTPGSYLTGDYWDGMLTFPFAALDRPPRRLAILGGAAGTTARAYGHYFPQTEVDLVEIDGKLVDLGRKFFDLKAPKLNTFIEDARPFLRRSDRVHYDLIMLDAYRQPYIPFYLTTTEFFELCRLRLTSGGAVVINVGHPEGEAELERVMASTLRTQFKTVLAVDINATNTLLLATNAPASSDMLSKRVTNLPSDLQPLAKELAVGARPALTGVTPYTDDRAPVEWLIDRSIVAYASSESE